MTRREFFATGMNSLLATVKVDRGVSGERYRGTSWFR